MIPFRAVKRVGPPWSTRARSPSVRPRGTVGDPESPGVGFERDPSSATRDSRPATRDLTHLSLASPHTQADPADAPSDPKERADAETDANTPNPSTENDVPTEDDDPVDQSLTFAYVLPDDAEHACEAFSVPATRKSAACAVKWDGPESGHELAVTEQTMRAYAAKPRVAFTITREAPFVVPGGQERRCRPGRRDGRRDERTRRR